MVEPGKPVRNKIKKISLYKNQEYFNLKERSPLADLGEIAFEKISARLHDK